MRLVTLGSAIALAALASSPALAVTAPPKMTTVADPAADQTKGDAWNRYPAQRTASDLRRAVFATEQGTLRLTWTFAASPSLDRVYQTAGMSGTLGGRNINFTAWKHGGKTYAVVFGGASGSAVVDYCKGRSTVAVNTTAHTLTMRVPISCLPAGKVFDNPYPTSYLTVLKPSGVIEGTVASDPAFAAPDFAIRD